jgi:hypothetical protein
MVLHRSVEAARLFRHKHPRRRFTRQLRHRDFCLLGDSHVFMIRRYDPVFRGSHFEIRPPWHRGYVPSGARPDDTCSSRIVCVGSPRNCYSVPRFDCDSVANSFRVALGVLRCVDTGAAFLGMESSAIAGGRKNTEKIVRALCCARSPERLLFFGELEVGSGVSGRVAHCRLLSLIFFRSLIVAPSFRTNMFFHWILFAWLAWFAFPWLGELP